MVVIVIVHFLFVIKTILSHVCKVVPDGILSHVCKVVPDGILLPSYRRLSLFV
jgi:hypothetical protein